MSQLNLPILSVLIFCAGTSCIIFANLIFATILGEVDGRGEPHQQISMLFVNVRFFEVTRLHKELFPDRQKRTAMYVTAAVGFALVLGVFAFSVHIGLTR